MKYIMIACWLITFLFIGFVIGAEYAEVNPSPHQCISVCVEEFERMAC